MSSEAGAILPSSSAGAMPAQNRNETDEWSDSDRRFCRRVHETVRTTCPEPQDVDQAALRANWQAQCSRYAIYFIGE